MCVSLRLVEIHRHQELRVARNLFEAALEQLDGFHRVHVGEDTTQAVDEFQLLRIQQQLFTPRAGAVDVDRRISTAIDKAAIEVQLGVAGALELFEDHFVHL